MNDYFIGLAREHRALAAAATGSLRANHQAKADQYERLGGARDLYRKGA